MILRTIILIALGAVAFLAWSTIAAAEPTSPMPIGEVPASKVRLEIGHGRVLRFASPITSIFVADDKVADVKALSRGLVYLQGHAVGVTNLIALDAQQRTVGDIEVTIVPRNVVEGNGQGEIDVIGKRVVGHGAMRDVREAVDFNAMLKASSASPPLNLGTYAGAHQINIRVRFAEVARDELLNHGVEWSAIFRNGSMTIGAGDTSPVGAVAGSVDRIEAAITALQSNGSMTILAEPNITAVSGSTASFLAGGEIPIPVPIANGLVGIQYRPYGVSLSVTPTLLPGGRIGLDVRPEVSTISAATGVRIAGTEVPAFFVRRVDTRVEMGSGQTFAIAGLFQQGGSDTLRKIPLLGDIPILGSLFRSRRFQRNKTELVVLITPFLVQPVNDAALVAPADADADASVKKHGTDQIR